MTIQIPALKSPFYITENLPGGELPPVLWRWLVDLLSQFFFNKIYKKNGDVSKLMNLVRASVT